MGTELALTSRSTTETHILPAVCNLIDLNTARIAQYVNARAATDDEAETLKVRDTVSVLEFTRITSAADGRPVELLHRVYNGDRGRIVTEPPGAVAS
ncbi:UTRA domain-containing protein [Planomonospora parontospora]|uniref:UTRA domain-containing protein n=1 Tax=Planomonospora parontospora TaxID=58119 RepID=UPI00167136A5|nr:UTRA domain-containing protein [Planomonospora parontospora]GGL41128.1 hypothetical protein GCM10014719_48020 [Planomonospora parontospora subsp. antibiotica]GII17931.1 hypothetical protein Ppa05_46570 [Planomonospora parontospora subsp. antibiotica]